MTETKMKGLNNYFSDFSCDGEVDFITSPVLLRACEQSRKRSGASRKSGERERSGEQTFQKTFEREQSVEREAAEQERSGERGLNQPLKVRSVTLNILLI